ncbi:MAG: PAS domain S-box protein [Planctomycetia bacterium]|nr:PAS domain S-box protein [Planctomycetia bacterium]
MQLVFLAGPAALGGVALWPGAAVSLAGIVLAAAVLAWQRPKWWPFLGADRAARASDERRWLQLLHETARAANQASSAGAAVQETLDRVCQHLGWPVGHAYLIQDAPAAVLLPTAHWHLQQRERFEAFRRGTLKLPVRKGEGWPGQVQQAGKSVWLPDVTKAPGFERAELARAAGLRTGLGVPVLVGREVVAVLEFFTPDAVALDTRLLDAMDHLGTELGRVIERQRARDALQEVEARFRCVTESAPEAIVSTDQNGVILTWNRGAQAIFGHTEEEAVGRPLTFLMPLRYHEAHRQGMRERSQAKEPPSPVRTLEFHGLRKNGSEFPVEINLARWRTARGTFYSGILRDVTERKRAEESVRLSEAMFKGLFDAAPDAIVVADRDGKIIRINRLAEQLFGYPELELLGEPLEFLLPERHRERLLQERTAYMTAARPNAAAPRLELHVRRQDGGELPVDLTFGTLKTERHVLLMATVRDITERKLAEAALQTAHDELEVRVRQRTVELAQANQALKTEMLQRERATAQVRASLKEKEMLLREVHHRVKNNLQIISSLLSIQSHGIRDPQALTVFKESQNRVRSIAAIHQKLLRSDDLGRIDFGEYVHGLVEGLFRSYGVDDRIIRLKLDIEELRFGIDTAIPCALIINELVTNALKHAFPDRRAGEIGIRLRAEGDEHYRLTVWDDGDVLPRNFDPHGNDSVGFQIVNALTEQLDGSLELSTNGKTAFHIRFTELKYRERR